MESDYHWLVTTGLVTSSIIAVTANSFLLILICRRRGLRTVPNRFVINLLITNLLSSLLLIPLLVADQKLRFTLDISNSTQRENASAIEEIQGLVIEEEVGSESYGLEDIVQNGDIEITRTSEGVLAGSVTVYNSSTSRLLLCYFAQSSTSFVCTASIFSILLIGINQYFGVIHSLRYHFYINKCRASISILSSWIVALIFATLSCLSYTDNSLWHFCPISSKTNETARIFNTVYALSYFIVVILAPFVSICIIYVCIYKAAHKNSERMRRSTSACCNANLDYIQVPIQNGNSTTNQLQPNSEKGETKILPKVHSAPNFSHLEKQDSFTQYHIKTNDQSKSTKVTRTSSERCANNFITNLKHKISNASVFRYREETRAAKISILVIFLVLICYIPYGITLVLNTDYIQIESIQLFNYLSLVLLVFSNIISPFLFGYRNKRIKREIGKIFGFAPNSNPNNLSILDRQKKQSVVVRNRSFEDIHESCEHNICNEPFLPENCVVPEVVVTCKPETERKSILKRGCNSFSWSSYKKCNFITVPDSCISGEARGSFSSASTQISNEE